jgi:hypothetical protein
LNSEHHLDLDHRTLGELLVEEPGPVRGLGPRWPLKCQIDLHPWWVALTWQAVDGLPGDVSEEDVGLEPFFERLTLEKR